MSTQKNTATIQKEWPVLSLANGEERGHNPKEVAGLEDGGEGVVVLVKAFDGGGSLEKVKVKVEALVELLELWWF